MPNEPNEYDIRFSHDLGTLEGKIAAIYENTKVIPKLIEKVEKHETQLNVLSWVASTTVGAIILGFFGWLGSKFSSH
jgi:hypothetical protein